MTGRFYFVFISISSFLLSFYSHAQEQEVMRGIIVDSATFNPLPYVNIKIKNTFRGTNTDTQGNFSVLASRKDTLIISLVGYQTIVLPLWDWEPSMIRMAESNILLKTVTIYATPIDPYQGMFDEQNAQLAARKNRFYYSRQKKEKRRVGWLREDNLRVKTYVDVVINDPETKERLMREHALTEVEYYAVLAKFNEKNYTVMYYLTAGELSSLLNRFFEQSAPEKK
jgi:CarboxypepD_reg-like domain